MKPTTDELLARAMLTISDECVFSHDQITLLMEMIKLIGSAIENESVSNCD